MVAVLFCSTHHSTKAVILAKPTKVVILAKPAKVVILAKPAKVVILAKPAKVVILAKPESLYFAFAVVVVLAFAFAVVFFQGAVMNAQSAAESATEPHTTAIPPAHLRRLVLTGFMGAGKTTVGRLLAARLNWDFLDLDAYIESRTGLSVPSIFSIHGEAHFRQLESAALASALGRSRLVLALGGGAPEVLTNRLLLEQTPATSIIFLDAPFPALFDRCMMQALNPARAAEPNPAAHALPEQFRPLLADPATAEARFLVRQPIYRRLARLTLDTASLTPEETVTALLARLT